MGKTAFVGTSALAALLLSTAAHAGPSTQEGADRILASFQTYLGATPGVVTVSPTGEAYKVVIDTAPLSAKAGEGFTLKVSPIELMLTDRGDGTWDVAQDQGFSVEFAVGGEVAQEQRMTIANQKLTGIWDEALFSFTEYQGAATGFVSDQTSRAKVEGEAGPAITQRQEIDTAVFSGKGAAGAAGGVDATQDFTVTGLRQTVTVDQPGGAPLNFDIAVQGYGGTLTASGFRSREIMGLLAFFAAHPSESEIKGAQEDLRTTLTAALPLFGRIEGAFDLTDLTANTPVGPFGAAKAGVTIEMNGAVADGKLREALRFEGLSFPPGLVPEWALPLIPKTGTIDVAGIGFDAAAMAAKMIGAFDLTKTPPFPETFGDELLPLALPTGQATITLAPGGVNGADYALTWEGAMQVGPGMPMPTGTARVTAKGLDAVRQALTQAPPDVGGPAAMGIGAASAFAKFQDDGTLLWEIDATEPGVLKVNGRLIPLGAP
jgi:hypothetical protein